MMLQISGKGGHFVEHLETSFVNMSSETSPEQDENTETRPQSVALTQG